MLNLVGERGWAVRAREGVVWERIHMVEVAGQGEVREGACGLGEGIIWIFRESSLSVIVSILSNTLIL